MNITNPWVGYFHRTYQQIKSQLTTALATSVPELTDHSENTLHIKMVSLWAGVAEMLGFYIDSAARETYVESMRLPESARSISNQLDYRVHAAVPASVRLTFTADAPLGSTYTIPAGTVVATDTGVSFRTVEPVDILAGQTEAMVDAVQSEGTMAMVAYSYAASEPGPEGGYALPLNAADNDFVVKVNGVTWLAQESLAYSNPTSRHYVQSVRRDGVPVIYFGDGTQGLQPQANDPIQIYYRTTLGDVGNVPGGTVVIILTPLIGVPGGVPINVNNILRASGGAPVETLESMRYRIPRSLRVMDRAVTRQDYIDTAELAAGVARAGVQYDCGKWVDIYIVPDGGGLATNVLLASTKAFVDLRRMITTRVRVLPAGEVHLKFTLQVRVKSGYNGPQVLADVLTALHLHLSYVNQEVSGTVYLSDLYEVIEAVPGVASSVILPVFAQPFAHRNPDNPSTVDLNWTVTGVPTTTTSHYQLVKISGSDFHLFKDSVYVTQVAPGTPVTVEGLTFTVGAAGYLLGDVFDFWTYPSNLTTVGSLTLSEPSLPVAITGDINVVQVP